MIRLANETDIVPQHELVVDIKPQNEVHVTVGALHCVLQTDAVWVRNGEKEVQYYVDTVVKPELNQIITQGKDDFQHIISEETDELNQLLVDNKESYQSFTDEQKDFFNANVQEQTSQFNQHVISQQNMLDNHILEIEDTFNQKQSDIEVLAEQVAQNTSETAQNTVKTQQYVEQSSQSAQTAQTAVQSVQAIQTDIGQIKNETISVYEQTVEQIDLAADYTLKAQQSAQTATDKLNEVQTYVQEASQSAQTALTAQQSAQDSLQQMQMLMDDTVTVSGNQIITGRKTFITPLYRQSEEFDSTQNSVANYTAEPIAQATDKSGRCFMNLQYGKETNGTLFGRLSLSRLVNGATHEHSLNMGISNEGIGFIQCLSPQPESNSADIATTQWSRNTIRDITFPDWATCVEISGTGQKYAPYDGVLIVTPEDQGESCFTMIIGVHEYNLAQEYFGADYGHTGYGFFPMRANLPYSITHMFGCYCRFFRYIGG
ncbi:MAG: hypothetical protein IJY58_03585 [Alphaproteobacteria bacterium]|nr:hypothetical protein [Alphaproteobacteria bacterium]